MNESNTVVQFPANISNNFKGALPQWWHHGIPLIGKKSSIVYDAFISSSNITGWPHSVLSSVNSSAGDEIADSQFMRTGRINNAPVDYAQQINQAIKLKGEYIYLGWLITHYGHLLTESLSRFWYLLEDGTPKKYIVHANYRAFKSLPGYVIDILSSFNINESNLIILNSPVIVDKLHCPAQALRCDHSVGYHMKSIYQHIATSLLIENKYNSNEVVDKVYISRESLMSDARRFNESEVSNVFECHGFKVCNPEKMTLTEQLDMYYNAKFIAGPVGSGLHNAVFMKNIGKALIISPNNFLFKNDCLLSIASGYQLSYHLVDNGSADKVVHKPWHVDIRSLSSTVGEWLRT